MPTNGDFFQAIGHVSVFFATLDFMVSLLVRRLTAGTALENHRATRLALQDGATLGQKLRFLAAVDPQKTAYPDVARALTSGVGPAIRVSDERNRYIHDQWVFDPSNVMEGRIRRLRLVKGTIAEEGAVELTLPEMYAFLEEVGDAQNWAGNLLERIPDSGWASASPE